MMGVGVRGAEATGGMMLTCLLPPPPRDLFNLFIQDHLSKAALPTVRVRWALTGQSSRHPFSTKLLSSQIILACVIFTQNYPVLLILDVVPILLDVRV